MDDDRAYLPCFACDVPSWSTDLRHLPPLRRGRSTTAGSDRAAFTRTVVEAATSRLGEPSWRTAVRCIGGDGTQMCGAPIEVRYDGADSIVWSCSACGENGVITGFVGSDSDLSVFVMLGPELTWSLTATDLDLLREATRALPELRGTIMRAEPAEHPGQLVVKATLEELNDLDALIEHLIERTRGRAALDAYLRIGRSLSALLRKARPALRGS